MTKELSIEASVQLNNINKGVIDIPKLKNFLSRVEQLNAPSARKQKQIERRARTERTIK